MSSDPTLSAIECVLNAYRATGVLGSDLRSKMTRAATAYEKKGQEPKNLVKINDPVLRDRSSCYKYHIEGVTFFRTVREAKQSPLYKQAEVLGKKTPSPAFVAARRRLGQPKEDYHLRIATGRVDRTPAKQSQERKKVQERQEREMLQMAQEFERRKPKSKPQAPPWEFEWGSKSKPGATPGEFEFEYQYT